ncbi:hypothetical protein ACFE04_007806 [Oxalis oulophora]
MPIITLQINPQFLCPEHPHHHLSFSPIAKPFIFLQNPNFTSKFPSVTLSHKIQPIFCTKKNRKTKPLSPKLTKLILKNLPIIISNLNILPQPLNLLFTEISAGGGFKGGGGGTGGGGFGWWGRRKVKTLMFFVGSSVACCYLVALWFGVELTNEVMILCVGLLFGFGLIKGFKRQVGKLVMGLCLFGVSVCLGLKKPELRNWFKRYPVYSSVVNSVVTTSRRKGKRKFW